MKFRYVSNAGLIFVAGNRTVGVDCYCRDPYKIYQDTPEDIRREFNPDVLIFTHEHGDHFCAEYVKEAWGKNPNIQVYSTKAVIGELRELGMPDDNLYVVADGEKLVIHDEDGGENGACKETMQITFNYTVHEGKEFADIQNLTLFINIEQANRATQLCSTESNLANLADGTKKVVISGDAMACEELFERIGEWSKEIGLMLIPFPYLALRSTRRVIEKYLDVRNIFIMHLPEKNADVQNWREKAIKLCESAKDELPMPVFPEGLGGWYKL